MPEYALRCDGCGHTFEDFHGIRDPHPPCPQCGGGVSFDPQKQAPKRERQFYGRESESMQFGFGEDEVLEARQMFSDQQHCIRDDGTVVFQNRSEERAFSRRFKELYNRAEAEKEAKYDAGEYDDDEPDDVITSE